MANHYDRSRLRDLLENKFLGLEESGVGDFEYSSADYNAYLELSVLRCFPAMYKVDALEGVSAVGYGTQSLGYIDNPDVSGTVYSVEDGIELTPITGWTVRPDGRVLGLDTVAYSTFNVFWYEPYTMPPNDTTSVLWPVEFVPLVILGAVIEGVESRHDTGLQDDPDIKYPGQYQEVRLLTKLYERYNRMRDDVGMERPAVIL